MRIGAFVLAVALALPATAAEACTIILGSKTERAAFRAATRVVLVEGLTETYEARPRAATLTFGVGTARVLKVEKGKDRRGDVIIYRIATGADDFDCPAMRETRPGQRYRLFFDGGASEGLAVQSYQVVLGAY